jgi:hypothetical protein
LGDETWGGWAWREACGAWVKRSEGDGSGCDLAVASEPGQFLYDEPDEAPPPDAVDALRRAHGQLRDLKSAAVSAICEARQARLRWRAGPPAEDWSVLELHLDASRAIWAVLHEYETDEYSIWLVRFDEGLNPVEVRRAPFVAQEPSPPAETGIRV